MVLEKNKPRRKVRLTPGPTETPKWARVAMYSHSLHHRSKEFLETLQDVIEKMRELFGAPDAQVLLLPGSGTYMMELVIANFVRKETGVMVVNTGYFADRWRDMAQKYGGAIYEHVAGWGRTYQIPVVIELLEHHAPSILLMQATDTATGIRNSTDLGETISTYSPSTILAVDAVLEAGVSPIKMQQEGIDILIGASQKAFMLPPGLGFVLIRPRALETLGESCYKCPTVVFDIQKEIEAQKKSTVRFTPPVDHLAGMRAVLTRILKKEERWYDNFENRAALMRNKLGELGFRMLTKHTPSNGLSVLGAPKGMSADQIINQLDEGGFMVAHGLNDPTDSIIRIAHFGGIGNHHIERFLQELEKILESPKNT